MMKDPLPVSSLEAENVCDELITSYFETIDKSGLKYHSVMILRHGKVVTGKWFDDYTPDRPHPMHSVAKVLTGIASWFAIDEGLFSVGDKVISYFGESAPEQPSEYLQELEIYHLLTMTVGHEASLLNKEADNGNDEWIKLFLSAPILNKPGEVFEYNNLATYMLSALIQKLSGYKLIDFLRPRLLDPLGIELTDWEESPEGINVGGWGISLRTEDMAKIGLFLLKNGRWNDRQLLSGSIVRDACSFKVPTMPADKNEEEKDKNDWYQGYGYHIWQSRHNAFSSYGFFGQLIVVLPDKDAVVVTTGRITDMQAQLNLIWKYVLPAFK